MRGPDHSLRRSSRRVEVQAGRPNRSQYLACRFLPATAPAGVHPPFHRGPARNSARRAARRSGSGLRRSPRPLLAISRRRCLSHGTEGGHQRVIRRLNSGIAAGTPEGCRKRPEPEAAEALARLLSGGLLLERVGQALEGPARRVAFRKQRDGMLQRHGGAHALITLDESEEVHVRTSRYFRIAPSNRWKTLRASLKLPAMLTTTWHSTGCRRSASLSSEKASVREVGSGVMTSST
jgi:hypothetical protein